MAAGDTMVGRRLPLIQTEKGPRLGSSSFSENLDRGDYVGPVEGYTGDKPSLFYRLPDGHLGHVSFPPHTYEEHEDGTLTVSPSILARVEEHGFAWHGYLEHGVWREV